MDADDSHHNLPDGLLDEQFDVVQYLDRALPGITLTSKNQSVKQNRAVQIQSASIETQALLSKLNTFNARASTDLTNLTDEILRSGNRLAYEVEVLRSDASSLFDLLSSTLQDEIRELVHKELDDGGEPRAGLAESESIADGTYIRSTDPDFMQQLRLLGHVKSRLEEVIRIFGDALRWPIPPSDVSMASSLISVSAPELGVVSSAEDDKARATIRQYREEIADLLNSEGGGEVGLNAAQNRVEHFQNLAIVWKGTAEEKARNKVVEGFAKIVEDRRRTLGTFAHTSKSQQDALRSNGQSFRVGNSSSTAGGLWRKLRDEMYLD